MQTLLFNTFRVWIFIGVISFFLSGCASTFRGAQTEELLRPIETLNKAVYFTMKGSILRQSENQRTYYSNYHIPGNDINAAATNKEKRAQVIMTILGDRRPYRILVLYRVEIKDGKSYSLDHYDKSRAQYYLDQLNEYLASRPEQRDMIDDFRPY